MSPAFSGGKRGQMVMRDAASFPLAQQLRTPEGAPLGDVFSFLSGLYFRGKLGYARAFARPPAGVARRRCVITPSDGLVLAGRRRVTLDAPARASRAARHRRSTDARYRRPLVRDARGSGRGAGPGVRGRAAGQRGHRQVRGRAARQSSASGSCFPTDFVGRGDMSRGGLLLRARHGRRELDYGPVAGAVRHGPAPAAARRRGDEPAARAPDGAASARRHPAATPRRARMAARRQRRRQRALAPTLPRDSDNVEVRAGGRAGPRSPTCASRSGPSWGSPRATCSSTTPTFAPAAAPPARPRDGDEALPARRGTASSSS